MGHLATRECIEPLDQMTEVLPGLIRKVAFHIGPIPVTSTVVNTWVVMLVLFLLVFLIRRKGFEDKPNTATQAILEEIVGFFYSLIDQGWGPAGRKYMPLVGGFFTTIFFLNMSWFIPGFTAPTTDLMTTAALAVAAIILVHVMGMRRKGVGGYLRHYVSPTPIMLPMNILEEVVKPFSLAIRLFGNMFGESMVASIMFILVPLLVPVPIMMLGLLLGTVQAFVFSILVVTYLATMVEEH